MNPQLSVVIDVAMRYGVAVRMQSNAALPSRFIRGPEVSALSLVHDAILVTPDTDPADALHELVHVVMGARSLRMDEAFVLCAFEWRLAQHAAKSLSRTQRRDFMHKVDIYQRTTSSLQRASLRFREKCWWKNAERRAVKLKLLDAELVPTFQRAQWVHSGVPHRIDGWKPECDALWRLWRAKKRKETFAEWQLQWASLPAKVPGSGLLQDKV
jgi:hypothetical protein